jgi:alpha-glucosidase
MRPWWQRGVVYHVYPRSYQDASGDGVGDLRGIARRLGHLAWLGVDAVWLSPIYPSPMADFGYDVSDHCDVDPLFGTLSDLDALVAEAHRLGLRVLLDYVPNHTSDQHPWFVEARASRDGPRRAFYLWADPAPDGGPPTNWRSVFGGPAWELDPATAQCYYHAYLREQPDLNWRNPAVRAAMLDVLRFWLARGVDGFRVDALRQLVKDEQLRDNPPNPAWREGESPYEALLPVHTTDRPEVLDAARAMRAVLDEDGRGAERVLVGELYLPLERLVRYHAAIDLPANFHLISTPWEAEALAALVERYEALLPEGAWPNWVLGNHDRSRVASRVGEAQARVAAMLLLTLRGTPTIYYGDELGLPDVAVPPERVQDPFERNVPGIGVGRDPVRSPMPWDGGPHAGFCPPGVEPWLPLVPDAAARSVAAQREDPGSVLTLHRRLLALRPGSRDLTEGAYATLAAGDGVLAYRRGDAVAVALNLTAEPRPVALPTGRVVLSTRGAAREGGPPPGVLAANEGVVVACAR